MSADYPDNFKYTSSTQTLSWDNTEGVEEVEILISQSSGTPNWSIVYEGGGNHCPLNVPSGIYYMKGKNRRPPGNEYCPPETVTVG